MLTDIFDEYLYHSGVDGMKWYVHRFGNWERHAKYANGQPNPDTRIKRNVFISGTSKLKLEGSEFYRKSLPREVRKKVDEYIKNKDHIIIGDAPGIDTEVQRCLAKKGYKDVSVYTIGKHPRAYFDEDKSLGWTVKKVKSATGDQADKDKAMSDDADIGFAVTIEDGAKATRNNVKRMEDDGKNVEVFSLYKNGKDAWEKSNKKKHRKVSLKEEMMDDKITAYQRSPNEDISHSGVDGMKWYIHKFGNWERHAKYANGQPNPETAGSRGPYSSSAARDARLVKKAAKKARKEAKNKELRDKLLGVEAEKPRKELEGKTSDELKELTQRLKIENDYIAAIKQAKQLDRDIASMTGSEGLIKEYEKKLAKKLGVASGAVGNLVMYRSLVELFGEENAKILMGQKPGSGKGDKKKNDKEKELSFAEAKRQGYVDARTKRAKKEGEKEFDDKWAEKHPEDDENDEEEQSGNGGRNRQRQQEGPPDQPIQPQQTTPRQEEQEVDPDLSGDGYVDESFYRSPISDYYSRGSSNNYSDIYDYSYTNSASDRSVKTRNTEDGTDYYDRNFDDYGYYNGNTDKYKYFGPRQKRVTSIKTPKKITSRSKRKR